MLSLYDSPMLPIVRDMTEPGGIEKKGGKFFRAIGGLPIIRMLVETKPTGEGPRRGPGAVPAAEPLRGSP